MSPPTRFALFFYLAVSACMAPEEPPVLREPDVLTLDEFVTRYREEHCRRALYCTAPRHYSAWLGAAPELTCLDVLDPQYAGATYDAEVERGAQRGALAFDPERGAACLDALARSCSWGDDLDLPGCRDAIVGSVPVGSECGSRYECVPGAFCASSSGLYHCDGVCTPLPPEGGACEDGCDHCEVDLCTYYAPTVVRNLHEPCGSNRTDSGAIRRTQCSGELLCQRQLCDPEEELTNCPPTCQLMPREGQPCSSVHCGPGLVCVAGTCEPMIVETVAGASCDDVRVFCDRFHHLLCDEGHCVEIGGGPGARCTGEWPAFECDEGLRCDPRTSTCIVPGPDGTPCFEHAECVSGICWAGRCDTRPECPD